MSNIISFLKSHVRDIIFSFLFLVLFAISCFNLYFHFMNKESQENSELTEIIANHEDVEVSENNSFVFVDVKGAVKNPGVYEVDSTAIINDVITLAGGFQSNAYQNGINLSKKVSDEMVIYIYTKSEIKEKATEAVAKTNDTCKTTDYDICKCVEQQESVIETNSTKLETTDHEDITNEDKTNLLVNINTAGKEELLTLSGIGEAKAEAIINYRNEFGLFKAITDIMNVSGIGEALFAKIQNFITI